VLVGALSITPGVLVLGILLGDRLGAGAAWGLLLAAALAVLAAVGVHTQRPAISWPRSGKIISVRFWTWAPAVLLLMATLLIGIAVEQRALNGLERWSLAEATVARAEVTVWGTVVDDPTGSRWVTEARVRVDRARLETSPNKFSVKRIVAVRAEVGAAKRLAVLEAGDEVALRGWLRPLTGYDLRMRWQHAAAALTATDLINASRPRSPLAIVANSVRGLVLSGTAVLAREPRALMAGFLLGDTRDLSPEVLNQFRSSGLSHLLAVSGSNVAFVLALVGPLVRRFSRLARLLSVFLVLVIFGAMTRWEPSVLRACAMAACAVFAVYVGRPAQGVRILGIAVFLLLLIDPFLLHSIAFLLSVGASLGITVLSPVISRRIRGPEWLRVPFATTAAAQIGVTPVLLLVFGSIPLVSIPANLLAVPLVGPLTIWGLASGVVGGLVDDQLPQITHALQWPTEILAGAVLGIADLAGRLPLSLSTGAVGLLIFMVLIFMVPVFMVLVLAGTVFWRRGALISLRRRMLGMRELVLSSGRPKT